MFNHDLILQRTHNINPFSQLQALPCCFCDADALLFSGQCSITCCSFVFLVYIMHYVSCQPLPNVAAPLSRSRWIAHAFQQQSGARWAGTTNFIQHHVSLGTFTSLKCGGVASQLAVCTTEDELFRALQHAQDTEQPCMTLGYGSNVLTFDFDGLVIINRVGHMREALSQLPDSTRTGKCILKVGAGQSLQQLALASARLGWSGLEFAAGIPASVGGAVCSNAGAHGQEMSSVVEEVLLISDTFNISRHHPTEDGWEWGYRELQNLPNGCISSVSVRLHADQGAKDRVQRNLRHRRATQPVQLPSAGCIFKNPPTGDSAGRLLEKAGMKGVSVGGASISQQHANFFVNSKRQATPDDFLQLITLARDAVRKQSSVLLDLEVKIIQQGSNVVI